MKRIGLSKKIRFDVFKRDSFLCQYCGNHPPTIVLEIDHISPVSAGGTNDIDNLVTACFDCNRGKGASLLDAVSMPLAEKAALVLEREAQLAGYHQIMEERRARIERDVGMVTDKYELLVPGYTLTDSSIISVKHFVKMLGAHAVIENLETAWSSQSARDPFKYFCGICWKQIRGDQHD
jgi:hypothetical protein